MNPQVHQLTASQHHVFLEEKRHDPITGERIQKGDEVVFCAACRSAFLLDTWEYLDKKHCGQSKTLPSVPTHRHLRLQKRSITFYNAQKYNYANFFDRALALIVDGIVFSITGVFLTLIVGAVSAILANFTHFEGFYALIPIWIIAYFLFFLSRDGWSKGASLGKGGAHLRVIRLVDGKPISILLALVKTCLLPLDIVALPVTLFYGITLADRLTGTRVIRTHSFENY